MGNVYNVLGKRDINDKTDYFATRLIVEDCENIHLHYRNLRIEFSDEEFKTFADVITEARKKLNECRKND